MICFAWSVEDINTDSDTGSRPGLEGLDRPCGSLLLNRAERDRERESDRRREKERDGERVRGRQKESERERARQRLGEREIERKGERDKEGEGRSEREGQIEREKERRRTRRKWREVERGRKRERGPAVATNTSAIIDAWLDKGVKKYLPLFFFPLSH